MVSPASVTVTVNHEELEATGDEDDGGSILAQMYAPRGIKAAWTLSV